MDNELSGAMHEMLYELGEEVRHLDERVERFTVRVTEISRDSPACRRLEGIPDVGPMVTIALVAAVGDGKEFRNARGQGRRGSETTLYGRSRGAAGD